MSRKADARESAGRRRACSNAAKACDYKPRLSRPFLISWSQAKRAGMKAFRIGIDERALGPLGLSPFETLDWAIMNEADGVQFSAGAGPAPDRSFLQELAQYAEENRLYLEWGGGEYDPHRSRDRAARRLRRRSTGRPRSRPMPWAWTRSGRAASGPKRWEKNARCGRGAPPPRRARPPGARPDAPGPRRHARPGDAVRSSRRSISSVSSKCAASARASTWASAWTR